VYRNSFNEKPYTGVVYDDGLELYILMKMTGRENNFSYQE
jgi:hypothetical protein